jgi:hypothetical protein
MALYAKAAELNKPAGLRVFWPVGPITPAFCNHILSIIKWRTKKPVVRILARWVIAGMANKHLIRNRLLIKQLPAKAVSSVGFKFFKTKFAVSIFVGIFNPGPTIFWAKFQIRRMVNFFSCRWFVIRVSVSKKLGVMFRATTLSMKSIMTIKYGAKIGRAFTKTLIRLKGVSINLPLSKMASTISFTVVGLVTNSAAMFIHSSSLQYGNYKCNRRNY